MTSQRIKILDFLKTTRIHPSAEQVYEYVVKELPTITLATVYRNLNNLADEGLIVRLKVGHTYRYDGQEGIHAHGICEGCGKIVDIGQAKKSYEKLLAIKHNSFTPKNVKVIYSGTCKDCLRGEQK